MEIKINGIFDKYNNTVNLDKKCNIFIGENGVGKSTTMKIVKSLLSGDFIELLKYYFKSIEIIDNDTHLIINYCDLFPKLEDILDITNNFVPKDTENKYYSDTDTRIINIYYKDLCNIVKDNKDIYRHLIRTIINENNNFSHNAFKKQYNVESNNLSKISYSLIVFYKFRCETLKFNNIKYLDNTTFCRNKYYENIDKLLAEYNKISLISNVREIDINNDVWTIPTQFFSSNLEYRILDSYKKEEKYYISKVDRGIRNSDKFDKNHVHLTIPERERYLKELFEKYDLEEIINNTIYSNIYENYDLYKDLMGEYNDDGTSSIDIKKVLFKNYYDLDTIKKFTRDYYIMLKKMVNREYSAEELNLDLILEDDFIMNKYYYFMEPLIPHYSFYRYFMLGTSKDLFTYETLVFNKFIHDNLDYYMEHADSRVKKLDSLLSEYFKSKKIYSSPNGLIISDELDYNNRYNFKYLSEGERRVIVLLILSIFNDNDVLLIDEPETSLSVLWQQRLIDDLLDNGSIKHLIVSTQSPFIVDDDKLMEYVTCLPGDGVDE
ncbi:MAG: AAA family ATPase [Bacilli bacterium]|nr:AAA family ATPase [Bacilli bacterium]